MKIRITEILTAFLFLFHLLATSPVLAVDVDLAVTSFTAFQPAPIAPGGHPTSISYSLHNYGPGSVGNSFGGTGPVLLNLWISSNATFGDGDDLYLGQMQFAISSPAGSDGTYTHGNVNGLSGFTIPTVANGTYRVFLQITHPPASGRTDPDMSDNVGLLSGTITVGGGGDTTPPTVTSISRLNPTGQFTRAASVVWRVTFSELINDVSTADFTLVDVSGTLTGEGITGVSGSSGTSIDVTASTGSSGDGTLRLDLLVDTATITDAAGNSLHQNFTIGEAYSIDRTAPVANSLSPADGAVGVALDTDLVITFSEPAVKGAGNIVIRKSSDDSVFETIAVTSAQVTISNDLATVDPSSDFAAEKGYYVQIDSGAFENLAGNDYAGISGGTTWNFTTADTPPPTVINVSPSFAGGALAVGATSLRIAFSKPVTGGNLAENYQLQSLGPDALLGTADDAIVPVSAIYAGTMVTLGFAALPASVYRLTVRDTITASSGMAINGDGDGAAGGNCVKDFVAVTANDSLFQFAPAFDTGLLSTSAVAAGDFDGDGRNDLAIGSFSTGSLAVMRGRTDGTFSDPIMFGTGGSGTFALAVGDFDGDGRDDLAAGLSSGVAILLGEGDGTFSAAVRYGTFARSIAVADYDGNGSLDLAVANSLNNTIGILLNNRDGSFHGGTPLTVTGIWPKSVAAGDFNGDGAKDLVMINGSFADRAVRLWLGRGDGTFNSMVEYDTQDSELESPVIGDFNGDGLQDLAVAHGSSGSSGVSASVAVLLGKTDGHLSPVVNYPVGIPTATAITIGDFDDDGRQDIAVATGSDRCVRLLLGLGDGTFAVDDEVFGPGGSADLIAAGDFDGDGTQDLVVATDRYDGGTFALLRGHGDGGFVAATGYGTPGSSVAVASGDFDGNGWLDLVSANRDPDNVSVYLNQGGGTLTRAATYGTGGSYPSSVVVGDFNRDGHADLALNNISGNLGVLLGRGDGTFDTPVTYNYAGHNSSSMSVADINGDGIQDLAVATDGAVGQRQSVSILLGRGDGTFAPAVTYASGVNFSSSAAQLAVQDFNGDGRDDIALTDGGTSVGFVSVFLANSDGTLSTVLHYDVGGDYASPIVVGDFDDDGHHDLAVGVSGSMVSVLLGLGDGTFAAPLSIGTENSFSTSLAVGDFDGDGHQDLAVGSPTVEIILGNGDGTFDSPLTFVPPGYYVFGPMAAGDYNGDGRLDLAEPNGGTMTFGLLTSALSHGLAVLQTPRELDLEIQLGGFMAGQLVQGPDNAFDGLNRLQVSGADYAPTANPATHDDGRTVVTGTQNLAGLNVHREVTVPKSGNEDFARTVDVFENPTGTAITTTVRIVGNLGSDAATTVFATSDGDTDIERSDLWIGTDDDDGTGTPAIVHYIHGPMGLQPTSVIRAGDNIEWTYQLTVPAGQTARLAHFTVLAQHRADAIAAANALVTPSGFGGQAAAFLTPGELQSVANFSGLSPEINVSGNNVSIIDGDASPSVGDHTDFGTTPASGGTVVRTFTIANSGTGVLHMTGTPKIAVTGPRASEFTVTQQPASLVAAINGTTTFQVTFDPNANGLRTATLSIASDDANENPYDFAIQGTGLTALQSWRQFYFGTTANAGAAADMADGDVDGSTNLVEFATSQDPTVSGGTPAQRLIAAGDHLEFTYTRNKAAMSEVTFAVQWNDNLSGAWSIAGVSEVILSDDGLVQQVTAQVPAGEHRRFVRLLVTGVTGLVVHYNFEGNALDSSGLGNDGTIVGSPAFTASDSSQAILFNNPVGESDAIQFVRLPNSPSILGLSNSSFTFALRYLSTDTSQHNGRLFGNTGGGPGNTGILHNSGSGSPNSETYVSGTLGSFSSSVESQANPFAHTADGTWHWTVTVVDVNTGTIQYYVDDHLIVSKASGALGSVAFADVLIGANSLNGGDTTYSARETSVDEFRLYSRALTAAEVMQLVR